MFRSVFTEFYFVRVISGVADPERLTLEMTSVSIHVIHVILVIGCAFVYVELSNTM